MDTFYTLGPRGGWTSRPTCCAPHNPRRCRSVTWEAHGAPVRVIAPGRVYRADYDQTHTPMFPPGRGAGDDRDISMANLKWGAEEFFSAYSAPSPGPASAPPHFPFTEPSPRSISSVLSKAAKGRWARATNWLEVLGSGMVQPRVLAGGRAWTRRSGRAFALRHGDRPDRDAKSMYPGFAGVLRFRPAVAAGTTGSAALQVAGRC